MSKVKKSKDPGATEEKDGEGKKKKEQAPRSIEEIYKSLAVEFPSDLEVKRISTGSLTLDDALGGGWPRGRIVELAGQSGTGKSTVLLSGCSLACSESKKVLYLDPEWAVNESLMDGTGCGAFNKKSFFIHKARTFAQIDQILMDYCSASKPPDIVVIDSAQSMLPSKKLMGSVEDAEPGLQSRFMASFLQKYKGIVGDLGIAMLIINQIRTKFVKLGKSWDAREESAGGNALKFYSDIRLNCSVRTPILEIPDDKDSLIGNDVLVRTLKNKVSPMRHCLVPVIFGKGISNFRSIAIYMEEVAKAVTRNGSWYEIKFGKHDTKVQGKIAFSEWIEKNYDDVHLLLKEKGILQ